MKRSLIAVLVGALALAGYAIFSAPRLPVTPAAASRPVATNLIAAPASRPNLIAGFGMDYDPFAGSACVFPDTTELAQMAGDSNLVVAGTVEGAPQVVYPVPGINQPFTRYALQVRSVLRGPAVTGVLTIMEAGGVVKPGLKPGPQIVFLFSAEPGSRTYTVTEGLAGIFLPRASGMTRECPHGPNPSVFVSDGSSEAAFSAVIRGLTPPPRPPHK